MRLDCAMNHQLHSLCASPSIIKAAFFALYTLDARGFSLLEGRNTAKRREKPLVQAFENLTSMLRLIDIEKNE